MEPLPLRGLRREERNPGEGVCGKNQSLQGTGAPGNPEPSSQCDSHTSRSRRLTVPAPRTRSCPLHTSAPRSPRGEASGRPRGAPRAANPVTPGPAPRPLPAHGRVLGEGPRRPAATGLVLRNLSPKFTRLRAARAMPRSTAAPPAQAPAPANTQTTEEGSPAGALTACREALASEISLWLGRQDEGGDRKSQTWHRVLRAVGGRGRGVFTQR